MNKNVVLAVMKRDLRSWFNNPTGYVFILLFVGLSCLALMWSGSFFANNLANLDSWNLFFPWIAILFVAASAMNMWASERSHGTQELLFTLPARDFDLQFGKFLAGVGVFTMALLFTLPLPIALMWLGEPDWGLLFANYVGFWLFGALLVSVSMIGSQLTQNGAVAFILSALFCLVVVYLGSVMSWFGSLIVAWLGPAWSWLGSQAWVANGPLGQFAEFGRGMLPVSGFLLFLGLCAAFFYLSLALLGRRHWRDGMTPAHGVLRFAGGAVVALALTVIGVQSLPRADATFERIHSLSDESRKLLAALDPNKPVTITAYASEDVPEQFMQQRRLLLNLVDQFDALGGNAVQKRIVMPEPYSPEAREAEENYGIRSQVVAQPLAGGGYSEMQMFLGFVVRCGTDEIVNPFIEPAVPLEYELMRSVRVVAGSGRKKVGILRTDVELTGGIDMQTFRPKPRWQIADELQQQYELESVDPARDYPEGLACLVVPQPSSLVQEQMDRLKAWMLAGHPTLLLEDPLPLQAGGTAADDPKGGGGNPFGGGGGGEQKGQFAGLMSAIGLQFPVGEIVWDLSARSFAGHGLEEEFIIVNGPGVASDSVVTKGLQNIVFLMGGHVQSLNKEGFTVTPLLRSPDPSPMRSANGIVRKSQMFIDQWPMGQQINPYRQRERRNDDLVLAARVTNKPAGEAQKGVDVVFVADLDLVSNDFFMLRRQRLDANLRFDNVTFVLNCIDTLVGDESLIELRKRRPKLRKLDKVEESQQTFEEKWTREKAAAEGAAAEELKQAQQRLDDAVAKIRDDKGLDEAAKEVKIAEVQNRENRRLELAKAQIETAKKKKIEMAAHDRNASRRAVENGYRLTTLLVALLPGLLMGVVTLFRRHARATAIVPASRRVADSSRVGGSHGIGGVR